MLDREGYRPNVGIILVNARNEVFWGKRIREHSWQFPQGGIKHGESPEQAMYRELFEEVGLKPEHVRIIGRTRGWLRYDVPKHWIKREWRNTYRGQKQIWFLLRLVGRDSDVCLRASNHPEFDAWRWSYYWVPLEAVIEFKRGVYQSALLELSRLVKGVGYKDAVGLKAAVAIVLGEHISKSKRISTSNWAAENLSAAQLLYAANDAFACLRVYQALHQRGLV